MKTVDDLQKELRKLLQREGAVLVGFADLKQVADAVLPVGISVGIPLPVQIVEMVKKYPTQAYYDTYLAYNHQLDHIVSAGESFLRKNGFSAFANTSSVVKKDKNYRTPLPHKTVATLAGLGWIGKSCLLVTPEFGSAVRISSLLTDAPFVCGNPITESRCGSCSICVQQCPGKALKGTLWKPGVEREAILDVNQCIKTCDKKVREHIGQNEEIHDRICGKCFAVCAVTQKYLHSVTK
jgi:epoxyqueuosine reductase